MILLARFLLYTLVDCIQHRRPSQRCVVLLAIVEAALRAAAYCIDTQQPRVQDHLAAKVKLP